MNFFEENPHLEICREQMFHAHQLLSQTFQNGKRIFLCGNGGSFSDCLHIHGELMKSFEKERPLSPEDQFALEDKPFGPILATQLEKSFPSHVLGVHGSLTSAWFNDKKDGRTLFAQELFGVGQPGDTLWAISTSGDSENLLMACSVAQIKGINILTLTGIPGGAIAPLAHVSLKAPGKNTRQIQESQIKLYHELCSLLENEFFGEG